MADAIIGTGVDILMSILDGLLWCMETNLRTGVSLLIAFVVFLYLWRLLTHWWDAESPG